VPTAPGAQEEQRAGGEGEGEAGTGGRGGGTDIDAIFSEAKSKKPRRSLRGALDQQRVHHRTQGLPKGGTGAPRRVGPAASPAAKKGSSKKARRKTDDGFTVYTEEELKWNKKNAGGTKLCPFDCDCCF